MELPWPPSFACGAAAARLSIEAAEADVVEDVVDEAADVAFLFSCSSAAFNMLGARGGRVQMANLMDWGLG